VDVGSGVTVGAGDGTRVGLRSFFNPEHKHKGATHTRKTSNTAHMRDIIVDEDNAGWLRGDQK